jgi:hypothetical protein
VYEGERRSGCAARVSGASHHLLEGRKHPGTWGGIAYIANHALLLPRAFLSVTVTGSG